MDGIIPISAINDFLYCPKSLYLHNIYSSFDKSIFNDKPQTIGIIIHDNIERRKYSTSTNILQSMHVYSSRLGIKGKIDIYDIKKQYLIERKYHVKRIYTGYRYQLYAQMYCLNETGFRVKKLFIHSISDNKRYEIPLPSAKEKNQFEKLIIHMKNFDIKSLIYHSCNHCSNNIYGLLNW